MFLLAWLITLGTVILKSGILDAFILIVFILCLILMIDTHIFLVFKKKLGLNLIKSSLLHIFYKSYLRIHVCVNTVMLQYLYGCL